MGAIDWRSTRGFTIVEVLVSMILMLIVMGATLTTLDSSQQNRTLNDKRNDAVEEARTSIDVMTRQMRNLASPSPATPLAIDLAGDRDFAFRTFDPNKKLVRYCLSTDALNPNALYQMILNGAATPDYSTCKLKGTPTPGWTKITQVANDIVNYRDAPSTPIFSYNGSVSNTSTITNVRVNLIVDINAANKAPSPIRLASGAALRNQNQPPTALFSVAHVAGTRRFQLNGSNSFDPENRNLTYAWYADTSGAGFTPTATNQIGSGPTLDYTFVAGAPSGTYYFKLVVSDGNLTDVCPAASGATTNCTTAGPWTL